MWQAIRENPRAVTYAVLMHLILLVLLVISLDWTPKVTPARQPIQARLVDSEQLENTAKQQAEQRKRAEDKRKAEQAAKQKAEAEKKQKAEQAAKQKAEAEKQQQAEQAAKQKAETEKKQKAELAAKQKAEAEKKQKAEQAAKQKAEAEKQQKAELEAKQKAEAKLKAEQAAKEKAESATRQREAEQALQAQLAAEQEEERAQGVVAEYVAYIQEKVTRKWLRPTGSARGLSCVVQVSLIPGGDVAKVQVVQSSGDTVFDRSVETAVFKAAPLPLPKDPAMFRYFRDVRFVFKPN